MERTTMPLTRHHKPLQRRLVRDHRVRQRERADGELVHVRRGRRCGARGEDDFGEMRGDADVGWVADDFVVLIIGIWSVSFITRYGWCAYNAPFSVIIQLRQVKWYSENIHIREGTS